MIYSVVRMAVLALISLVLILILRNHSNFTKMKAIALFAGIIFIYYLLMFIPFENTIYTFPSAEAAWKYQSSGKIIKTIDGEQSSLIIFEDDDTSYSVYPKYHNGWRLNTLLTYKFTFGDIGDSGKYSYALCRYGDLSEYFIIVNEVKLDSDIRPAEIHDSIGSKFIEIDVYDSGLYITHYAIVPATQSEYKLSAGSESSILHLR